MNAGEHQEGCCKHAEVINIVPISATNQTPHRDASCHHLSIAPTIVDASFPREGTGWVDECCWSESNRWLELNVTRYACKRVTGKVSILDKPKRVILWLLNNELHEIIRV